MKTLIRIVGWLLLAVSAQAQVEEHFNDGELLLQPTWTGRLDAWTVTDGWLQSASTTANDQFYISTQSQRFDSTQWELSVQLLFNPSSANYVDWFLVAEDSNLVNAANGYFVRMGGTEDEISLYRKINGVSIKLIDGNNGVLNNSNNVFSMGLAGKYRVSGKSTMTFEYSRQLNMFENLLDKNGNIYQYTPDLFSLGWEINTGGHQFQLYISNTIASSPIDQLARNTSKIGDGKFALGFTINRGFNLKK